MRFVKSSLVLLALALVACSSSGDDERMPIGVPPPWVDYCRNLGFTTTDEGGCLFSDGTTCDQILFYQGLCEPEHSNCAQRGGTVTSELVDMGDFTARYAMCTMPGGGRCIDAEFVKTQRCP